MEVGVRDGQAAAGRLSCGAGGHSHLCALLDGKPLQGHRHMPCIGPAVTPWEVRRLAFVPGMPQPQASSSQAHTAAAAASAGAPKPWQFATCRSQPFCAAARRHCCCLPCHVQWCPTGPAATLQAGQAPLHLLMHWPPVLAEGVGPPNHELPPQGVHQHCAQAPCPLHSLLQIPQGLLVVLHRAPLQGSPSRVSARVQASSQTRHCCCWQASAVACSMQPQAFPFLQTPAAANPQLRPCKLYCMCACAAASSRSV